MILQLSGFRLSSCGRTQHFTHLTYRYLTLISIRACQLTAFCVIVLELQTVHCNSMCVCFLSKHILIYMDHNFYVFKLADAFHSLSRCNTCLGITALEHVRESKYNGKECRFTVCKLSKLRQSLEKLQCIMGTLLHSCHAASLSVWPAWHLFVWSSEPKPSSVFTLHWHVWQKLVNSNYPTLAEHECWINKKYELLSWWAMNVDLIPGGSSEPNPLTATRGDKLNLGGN